MTTPDRPDLPSSAYVHGQRLNAVRAMLSTPTGATIYEIAERLDVRERTAIRYLRTLERAGEPLIDVLDGRRKRWRLMTTAKTEAAVTLSTSQMVALYLGRRMFDCLEGTGFREDLDEVFGLLEATLRRRDFVVARELERKIHYVQTGAVLYSGRSEDVDQVITALLRSEQLEVRSKARSFRIDPYTLLVYKGGLYVAAFSQYHRGVRKFAIDGLDEVSWLRGERFEYPEDYHPSQLVDGTFGLIGGPRTGVRLRFDPCVARYVKRRQWHPSQELVSHEDGTVEMSLEVCGTVELVNWVLSFGSKVEVLEPQSLRREVAEELAAALRKCA
jgi:proteasome accessory factor B